MSSVTKETSVVKIKEIQKLFLASLLGPGENSLPKWASLDRSHVNRVAVILLKYVSAKVYSKNEECMSNLSQMFDVVGYQGLNVDVPRDRGTPPPPNMLG